MSEQIKPQVEYNFTRYVNGNFEESISFVFADVGVVMLSAKTRNNALDGEWDVSIVQDGSVKFADISERGYNMLEGRIEELVITKDSSLFLLLKEETIKYTIGKDK